VVGVDHVDLLASWVVAFLGTPSVAYPCPVALEEPCLGVAYEAACLGEEDLEALEGVIAAEEVNLEGQSAC